MDTTILVINTPVRAQFQDGVVDHINEVSGRLAGKVQLTNGINK